MSQNSSSYPFYANISEHNGRKTRTLLTIEKLKTIINMNEKGNKIKNIASTVEMAPVSVYKILNNYHKHVESGGNVQNFIKIKGRQPADKSHIDIVLSEVVTYDNALTQKGMQKKIFEQHAINLSIPEICKSLKRNNITRKRIKKRIEINTNDKKVERQNYALRIRPICDDNILFLDETGLNLHASINYGYSPKNTDAFITVPKNRGRNLSILAIINKTGIITYEKISGAYNTDLYMNFLQNAINSNYLRPGKTLVCDNVAFHRNRCVIDFLSSYNINYVFLPSYTPQLNPIEEVFSMIKSRYYQTRPLPNNENELSERIINIIEGLQNDNSIDFNGFYSHMRQFLDKAFNFEDF